MAKLKGKLSSQRHPVGVVKRSNAPLVDRLLAEQDQSDYDVAIDQTKSRPKLALTFWGTLSALAVFSALDVLKLR